MTSRLPRMVDEERKADKPADDWPEARKMRWALLHDGTSPDDWQSSTGLYVAMKALRDAGYHVAKGKRDGRSVYRVTGLRPSSKPQRKAKPKPEPRIAPELGANVVVFVLIQQAGEVVVGFAERDGRQWFAILTEPPT